MSAPNPTPEELEARETELFRSGPLSVLTASVKSNSQVSFSKRAAAFKRRLFFAPFFSFAHTRF
jgi:hypothetical protein